MPTLHDSLKDLKEHDISIDSFGRVVIDNPNIAKAVSGAVPNLKRVAGTGASNNCDCQMPQLPQLGDKQQR
ncbi:hypothetical protein [Nitrobacter sp.]|jgi:hypothetical protein|uniref:hypothetical protein n=1 Tax=Nitrobacter sp. TaxID=29420 RepID=UPI003F64CBA6